MSDEGNPSLLEGIFNDSSSSSEESEVEESTPEMILRAVSALGEKSGFINKWITAENGKLFYYQQESGKLLTVTDSGEYLEYTGNGQFKQVSERPTHDTAAAVESDKKDSETAQGKECILTRIGASKLRMVDRERSREIKKRRVDDEGGVGGLTLDELIEAAEETVIGVSEFIDKWGLRSEESTVRRFLKCDQLLVRYVLREFNPTKSKPKNALQGMIEALQRYPQKWRSRLLNMEESESAYPRHTLGADVDEFQWALSGGAGDAAEEVVGEIRTFGDDFFVSSFGKTPIFVDGIKVILSEGPVGPLTVGSVLAAGLSPSDPIELILVTFPSLPSKSDKEEHTEGS